jgi:hypothetical protein
MKHSGGIICNLYDALEEKWSGPSGHRLAGSLLVACFIASLVFVELKKHPFFEKFLPEFIPGNYLAAIEAAFTLLLMIEVMGLVFSIVDSVTSSVGRQLEILSLILLRDVFKEISHIKEPVIWEQIADKILPIAYTSVGAVVIFAILALFYKLKQRVEILGDESDKRSFIISKKIIALLLLVAFHIIVFNSFFGNMTGKAVQDIFESFYTLLIFSDIFIVLLSMRYGHDYQVAFRNSGFAVVTVIIRIALIAPYGYSAALGISASLFALAILAVYNASVKTETEEAPGA